MPKSTAFPDITDDYPNLGDVPTTAELHIVTEHPTTGIRTDYNTTPETLAEIMGSLVQNIIIPPGTVTNAMLAVMPPGTVMMRTATDGSGDPIYGTVAQVLTLLGVEADAAAALTDAEAAAQITTIAADATLGITFGTNALSGITKANVANATTTQTSFAGVGLVYSDTPITDGQIVLGDGGSNQVAGTTGVNLAADPYAHTSTTNAIAINFADGHGMFRTHATTEATKITVSNVPTYFQPIVQITASGSHAITFQSGIKVHPAAYKTAGISLTSGQTTTVRYQYDGTTIHAFVWAPGETST